MFSPKASLYGLLQLMFLFLVPLGCKAGDYKLASNCANSGECPKYTVIHSDKNFEIRSYDKATWMSSPKFRDNSYYSAFDQGAVSLNEYIYGQNVEHVQILPRALPILLESEGSLYTEYIYLPKKYQKNVPKPLSSDVKQVILPRYKYTAVRRVNGDISSGNVAKEIDILKKSLKGTPYQRAALTALFTIASNNFPYESSEGINEIWLSFD